MKNSREATVREYFFGDSKRTLSPHPRSVPFDEIVVFKIIEGIKSPAQIDRRTSLTIV